MGYDSFGLKIGIEGEKAFKQALSEINQAFKVLGSEMQLVSGQFDTNDKSAAALTARNSALGKEIDAQKDKISTLKSALDNAASSFGESDRRTQNWQIQLNKAEAELAGMERELKNNNNALKSNSDTLRVTADMLGIGYGYYSDLESGRRTPIEFDFLSKIIIPFGGCSCPPSRAARGVPRV